MNAFYPIQLILAQTAPVAGPMIALAVGVAIVVLAIAKWQVHPFFALIGAAIAVGMVVAIGGWPDGSHSRGAPI